MRKSHFKPFFYFSNALLGFFVLTVGIAYGQAPQRSKSSDTAAQASTKSAEMHAKVDLNTASEKDHGWPAVFFC